MWYLLYMIQKINIIFVRLTRCSWQETKVWKPGATPKPSWSMNGGSFWVWIWTLIPASKEVSSINKEKVTIMVCMHPPTCTLADCCLLQPLSKKWNLVSKKRSNCTLFLLLIFRNDSLGFYWELTKAGKRSERVAEIDIHSDIGPHREWDWKWMTKLNR